MRRPLILGLGFLLATGAVAGCSASAPFDPCPANVVRVEVFNTYADHPIADRHEVSGDDAADACATAFPYDRARQKTFSEAELGQRRLTVYRFAGSDGSVRTVRVHGLAGVGAGAAILMDDGRSFHIDSAGPEPYLTADAEVVPRESIP